MSAVKDNRPNLLARRRSIGSFLRCVSEHRTSDKGHGRILPSEAAGCSTSPSTATAPACLIARSPFASSASGASSRPARSSCRHETVHGGLTSVPPDQATSQVVLALVRGHWSIENRTTCATSPTTKTAAGYEPATCRAISPASPTWPSPSFASRLPPPSPPALRPAAPRRRAPAHQPAVGYCQPSAPGPTTAPTCGRPPCNCRFTLHTTPNDRDILLRANLLFLRLAPPQPIPTNHVLILAPNKISPWATGRRCKFEAVHRIFVGFETDVLKEP